MKMFYKVGNKVQVVKENKEGIDINSETCHVLLTEFVLLFNMYSQFQKELKAQKRNGLYKDLSFYNQKRCENKRKLTEIIKSIQVINFDTINTLYINSIFYK